MLIILPILKADPTPPCSLHSVIYVSSPVSGFGFCASYWLSWFLHIRLFLTLTSSLLWLHKCALKTFRHNFVFYRFHHPRAFCSPLGMLTGPWTHRRVWWIPVTSSHHPAHSCYHPFVCRGICCFHLLWNRPSSDAEPRGWWTVSIKIRHFKAKRNKDFSCRGGKVKAGTLTKWQTTMWLLDPCAYCVFFKVLSTGAWIAREICQLFTH